MTVPKRPAPPPLEARPPLCSICSEETNPTDGVFECSACGCHWPIESFHLHDGEWDEPDAPQCTATVSPFAESTYAALRGLTYRCVLADPHDGKHRHPDLIGSWSESTPTRVRGALHRRCPEDVAT